MNHNTNMDKLRQVKQTIDRIDDLLDEAMDLTYAIENLMIDLRYKVEQREEEEMLACL